MRAKIAALFAVVLMVPLLAALNGVAPASAAIRTRVTLSVGQAPIAQTASGYANRTVFSGKVSPARKGARVTLQRWSSGAWRKVGTAYQNRYGNYRGLYVAKQRETLRAVSRPGRVRYNKASAKKARVGYKLVFGENFGGSSLDANRWQTRNQPATGLRKCATPASDRVSVANGYARFSVKKVAPASSTCRYGVWTNAMIGSRVTYTHGYFAARVKFNVSPGMHGAFWLQGAGANSAEIDVAEYFGYPRNSTVAARQKRLWTMVHGSVDSARRNGTQLGVPKIMGAKKTPGNSYHVYAVRWTPKAYQFFIDGHLTWTTNQPYVSSAPSEIILSLLTSDSELSASTNPKSYMYVDWARGWQAP